MFTRIARNPIAHPPRSVLLLGPRQVGKSTLLASLDPDLSINLASPATYGDYVRQPERLELELRAAGQDVCTVFYRARIRLGAANALN